MVARPDRYGYGICDWCRRPGELDRHDSGHYACLDCQEHPEYPGGRDEGEYEAWLSDRGLQVDGWRNGWKTPVA